MNTQQEFVEKRRHKRFLAHDQAYTAHIAVGQTVVGQIVDISLKGLAFFYLVGKKPLEEAARLDIAIEGHDFHLEGVPCTKVSDVVLQPRSPLPYTLGRRGLRFGKLNRRQQADLKYFIRNFTVQPPAK